MGSRTIEGWRRRYASGLRRRRVAGNETVADEEAGAAAYGGGIASPMAPPDRGACDVDGQLPGRSRPRLPRTGRGARGPLNPAAPGRLAVASALARLGIPLDPIPSAVGTPEEGAARDLLVMRQPRGIGTVAAGGGAFWQRGHRPRWNGGNGWAKNGGRSAAGRAVGDRTCGCSPHSPRPLGLGRRRHR